MGKAIILKNDIVIFDNTYFDDERGSFTEVFVEWKMATFGLPPIKQINVSFSKANVVRGFHLQTRKPQGKYIRVLRGSATACVIDVRPGSFGVITEVFLGDAQSMYLPPGFANGFWTHSETIYHYGCTDEYDPGGESGVNPMDPALETLWKGKDVIVSPKDLRLPTLEEFRRMQ